MFNIFFTVCAFALVTWGLYIPFIGLLYKLKMQKDEESGRTDILGKQATTFQKLHAHKKGTPIGGGILVMLVTAFGFYWLGGMTPDLHLSKAKYLLLTYMVFGAFGLYDDVRKIIPNSKGKIMHMSAKLQLFVQLALASWLSYVGVKLDLFKISLPGVFDVSSFWVLFIVGVVVMFLLSNAYNIYDGLDGLGTGSMLITLVVMFIIFSYEGLLTEKLFIGVFFGAALAHLYYNVNPARMFNGDAGTYSIGAVLAVLLLTTNLWYIFPVLCFMYLADAATSFMQMISRKYFGKKIFLVAPIHHHFEMLGWHETKVVFRFWVLHAFFSLLALGIFFAIR